MVFACGGSIIAGESGMDFMGCLLMVRTASSAVLFSPGERFRGGRAGYLAGSEPTVYKSIPELMYQLNR